MAINFTQTPAQILLTLVNESQNPVTNITAAQVSFGTPAANDTAGTGDTKLTVTATAAYAPVTGSVVVTYNRVDIATVPGTESTVFEITTETKVSDLIPEINSRYGINLTTSEYTEADLPAATPTGAAFNLVIKAGSLVYTGTLALSLKQPEVPLADVITNTDLDGLTFTN